MTFKENVDQGIGTLLINSSFLSRSKKNPLGKLWELGIRKRFLKEYGVDVAGLFTYDVDRGVVSGSFCLNYAVPKLNKDIDVRVYVERFKDTFGIQMAFFEDIIEAFVEDTDKGLRAYEDLVEANVTADVLNELIRTFLHSKGVQTQKK